MSGAKLAKSTPEELNTLFSHSDFFIDLDHVDTIAEAFELRAKYTPKQVYMLFPSLNTYVPATFSEVFDGIEHCTAEWSIKLSPLIEQANATGVKPCVALLADSNPTYIVTCWALMRLNVIINLISTRASTAGMVHLLQETNSKAIIVSQAYQQHAARVREEVGEEMVQLFSICEIHEIAGKHATKSYTPFCDPEPSTSVGG
jgi:long-subunit acyl-CoA synthetase (AMP-forming)